MNPNLVMARQFGSSGGDCSQMSSSNCAIESNTFDALINLVDELF